MVDTALEHNSSHGSWSSEHSEFGNVFDKRQSFSEVFQLDVRVVTAIVTILSGWTSLTLHIVFLVTIGVTGALGSHVYHFAANAFMVEIVVAAAVVPLEVMNILASSSLPDTVCRSLSLLRLLTVSVLLGSYALLAFFLMADVCHPNWIFLTGRRELKAAAVLLVWIVPVGILTSHRFDTAVFAQCLMTCEFSDHRLEFFLALFLHLPSCAIVFVFYFITRRFHDKFYCCMRGLRVDMCLRLKHQSNTVVFNTLLCLLGEFVFCYALLRVVHPLLHVLDSSIDPLMLVGFLLYVLRTGLAALTMFFVNTDLRKAVQGLFSRNKGKVEDELDLRCTGGERENVVANNEVDEQEIAPITHPDGEDGTDPTVAMSDNYKGTGQMTQNLMITEAEK